MATDEVTTVILIRHADKDDNNDYLNPHGIARSFELIQVLSAAGIQAVYTSTAKRSKQTVKPFLAQHLSTHLPTKALSTAEELSTDILCYEGKIVLVVGHANTVPELIHLLGGPVYRDYRDDINNCEFDNLFVLVRYSATRVSLTRAKYGMPTDPC
jgi:phosphohistidine phosphatase SixA